ncbi:MAG: PQQ-binding-like beta-propeller repeat protein [Flavobacteriales bacterium]
MGRVFSILALLAAAAGCVYVWYGFRQDLATAPDPAVAVPADAVAVLRFEPDWRRTPAALHATGEMMDARWGDARGAVQHLDSLRLTAASLQELLDNGPFQWSLHRTGPEQYTWMFAAGVRPAQEATVWETAAVLTGAPVSPSSRSVRDAAVHTSGNLSACVLNGVLLISPAPALLEAGLARLTADPMATTPLDQRLARAGKPAAALLHRTGPSAPWSALELRVRQGKWEWAGMEPTGSPSTARPLAVPTALLPATTERVTWHTHSAAVHLQSDTAQLADINRVLADLDEVCACDYLATHFSPEPGWGLARLPEGPVLLMAAADTAWTQQLTYSHAALEEAYAGVGIFRVTEPYASGLLSSQPDFTLPLTWNLGGYQLFAADLSTAKAFIREATSFRTLDLTSSAITSADVRGMQANTLVWERNPTDWENTSWPLNLPAGDHTELLQVHVAEGGERFTSAQLLRGTPTDLPGNTGLAVRWEQELRNPGRGKPWMVKNHYTGARELFVQDTKNQVSLFSASGQRLWSATVDGPIQGEVTQVDLLRNGKLQLAFNTAGSIYILDRNGNLVDGFPVRLPSPASSPMAIFDYDNKRKYRFVIGTEDGKVHNYDTGGKATGGWKTPGFGSPTVELAHLRIRDKDYIFAREESGTLHLLKRNGQKRMDTDARTPGHNRYPSAFRLGDSMEQSSLFYADTAGNVLDIRFDRPTVDGELVGIMEGERLVREDITGDRNADFVLADQRVLKAYDTELERLFRTELTGTISELPQVFRFSNQDRKVGATVGQHNELYLLNANGEIEAGFPVEGNSAFSIGDMDLDGRFELATFTAYGTLKVYQLP